MDIPSNQTGVPAHNSFEAAHENKHPADRAQSILVPYFLQRSKEFQRLTDLRHIGWQNPEGDVFFQQQRQLADTKNDRTGNYFFQLMKKVGQELHRSTSAFTIRREDANGLTILDMCMAPGGFLQTCMRCNPGSTALAFSLPAALSGHKVLIPSHFDVEKRYLDVTMLAGDMGMNHIPADHPDVLLFPPRQFKDGQLFDMVMCDGQVLRGHKRSSYRKKREARRLINSQLALSLEHLRPGGNMIVLLHKFEACDTTKLLWDSHGFSSIKLLKPKTSHTKRSSFYMVATNVQSQHTLALQAIQRWKDAWRIATFGSDDDYAELLRNHDGCASKVLDVFGPQLVELGRDIWATQADALARASFI
ncbi:hypothetical protein QQS21_002304 [Conoideocrella luteorostrata]|uniref:Ribosomal RNA methyltransferase FtsJ domain-containing protein n=1 Tax=Conoideocrella luteorostrata TaxID=1105319 RepID=A0AAJ0CZM5_9HYPO|nr:hypothetical protein QQS21_002304 [Conoideocrella luteorostrata]